MTSFHLTLLFAAALTLCWVVKLTLASRQIRHVAQHRHAVPAPFAQRISLAEHQKAADYCIAKTQLSIWVNAFSVAVLLGWTLLGGLHMLNAWLVATVLPEWGAMGYQLALLGCFALISSVLDAPFDLYQTFVLEQRFGFNRMTWKLMLLDTLKGTVVGVLLGLPLAALVLWLMAAAGGLWWLWAWASWVGFSVLMMVIYPLFIAPLFNRFEPLQDATVASRVGALMARCGFQSKGLFVMDGSKRSGHGNAYFSGLGPAKRVVFFDTLLSVLNPAEIEAVLAHELGHFKHRHVLKRMVGVFALSLFALALLGWLAGKTWFYEGLGVSPSMSAPNDALALLLFMLSVPIVGFFVSPLLAQLSRKDEFEADAYACQHASQTDLCSALIKLYKDNASTLTPDPVFARFYYSHPPASERMAAMAVAGSP